MPGKEIKGRSKIATYSHGGRVKLSKGTYIGPSIRGEYGGVNLSNPHNKKYYKGMV